MHEILTLACWVALVSLALLAALGLRGEMDREAAEYERRARNNEDN